MIDLNHGARLPLDDIRADDVSERINRFIDAAFAARRAEQARREYVGASAIGNSCLRAVQYGYIGVPADEDRISGKLLRIFDAGHHWEEIVAGWMCMAGFRLDTVDVTTGKQYGFAVMGGKGKGHLDGILHGGPVPLQYPCLWEHKALNNKGWQAVKKQGLAVAKPLYAAQVALDQAYVKYPHTGEPLTNPALFTVLNKDTEELHHALIPFDQPLAQQMSDRMVQIVTATQSETLLPRAHASNDHFECKQFCDYFSTCWGKKR